MQQTYRKFHTTEQKKGTKNEQKKQTKNKHKNKQNLKTTTHHSL